MSKPVTIAALLVLGTAIGVPAAGAQETITRDESLAIDISAEGRIVMNLAGGLWQLPRKGGNATALDASLTGVERPRWSPDGTRIAYTALTDDRHGIWLYDLAQGSTTPLHDDAVFDAHPTWHPGGERITYASQRHLSGLDLWETDLPTGLRWRLTDRPGDETEPAWSRDGRHLVYVHRDEDRWSLVLRRHGEPEEILVSSTERLAGPSWRPDGSLVTFWREATDGTALEMVILSQPRLLRHYANGERFLPQPVAWADRQRMFYTADGSIRRRQFDAWAARNVPFRAQIQTREATTAPPPRRELPPIEEPAGGLVIHATRLFDGIGGGYRHDVDIVVSGGRITAVEPHTRRPGAIVIDMGDLVVMPGLVDARARLPAHADERIGPVLLASGVTTIVADHAQAAPLDATWAGKTMPGPRLLPAADFTVAKTSGLADAQTPGLDAVLDSRQARLGGDRETPARRHAQAPRIEHGKTDVVLGSRRSGLPAGIGMHAELRALQAAGLTPEQALRAAGVNAAAALGVDPALGRVAVGAVADLVFVDGDPLRDAAEALKVVAVVRNGRFYSVAGLAERAAQAPAVE